MEKDACFYYPCRVFGVNVTSNTFTETGYRDWKHALDSNSDTAKEKYKKGFAKHVASTQHSDNFSAWVDKKKRETSGCIMLFIVWKMTIKNGYI